MSNKKSNIPEIVQEPAAVYKADRAKNIDIPLDENGLPVGTPWEEVLENLYEDLSLHYGVNLRTL
ncbi:MAG: hypothetical protein LBR26_12500 [Prevotella sp.]|jgi:hypothetical protein|nr:hypothetical protein [Prevotella sp.]